jgi:myosin protein heavy chain
VQVVWYGICRVEEEVSAKAVMAKQLREKDDEVQELQEDLESERKARAKAEKTKNDLNEELEALRGELQDNIGTTAVVQEMHQKREQDLKDIKKMLDTETKNHEAQIQELRKSHSQQVEQFNEQLDQLKRVCIVYICQSKF